MVSSIDLLDARQPEAGRPSSRVAARLVADHEHVGLAAVEQAERHAGVSGMEQRALALRSRPSDRARRRASASRRRRRRSRTTTASIGMPPPAIMMPVWPVARKSASMPALAQTRGRARARCISCPSAQSVPTVSSRLPLRLRPVAIGMPGGGVRTSISRRPSRSAASAQLRDVGKPHVHAADEVEPGLERLDQRGKPRRRMTPPALATPITSDRAPSRQRLGGRQPAGPW